MRLIFLLKLLFLFGLSSYSSALESTLIDINKEYYFNVNTTEKIKFFNFEIPQKIPNENMILLVNGLTPGSDPDIFVSDSVEQPDSQDKADIYCSSFDLNICPITAEKIISMQQKFFVGIQCPDNCNFAIRIFYHEEHILTLNDEKYLLFSNTSKLVKINSTNVNNVFENIIVEFELMNPMTVKHSFSLYAKFRRDGTFANSTNYDFQMNSLGSGSGKGVINIASMNQCITNCFLSFEIRAPEGSIISIKVRAYKEQRIIEPYEIVEDFVLGGSVQLFKLVIDQDKFGSNFADLPFAFSLIPYDGDPDLHINADSRPKFISMYEWSSQEPYEERIVISSQDRKKTQNKEFFIAIDAGWQSSMFTLKAQRIPKINVFNYKFRLFSSYPIDLDQLYLVFDFPESGQLIADEIINYHLIMYGQSQTNVTLRLASHTGNAHLYVKQCTILEKTSCIITMDEIVGQTPVTSDFFKYSINTFSTDQSLKFLHEPENCHNSDNATDALHDGFHSCAYVVAVHAFVNPSILDIFYNFDAEYTLIAQHDSYIVSLKERQPIEDIVDDGNYNFYKFRLKNNTNITYLNFQLTPLTGHVSMFSSFREDFGNHDDPDDVFPVQSDSEVSSFWNSLVYKEPQNGWYYLSVQGDKLCSYTRNDSSIDENHNNKTNTSVSWFLLQQDKPQQISIHDQKIKTYFRFAIDTRNRTLPNSTFTITPVLGQFQVYISQSKKPLPSQDNSEWKVIKNKVRIMSKDLDENAVNNFYGVVVVDNDAQEMIPNLGVWSFQIEYHTTRTAKTLQINSPHEDHALPSEKQYYQVQVDLENDVVVSKQATGAFEKELKVYVSSNQTVNFPSSLTADFVLAENNVVTIRKNDLLKQCGHLSDISNETQVKCYIFLSVVSQVETTYSILTKYGQVPIPIFDGLPGHFQIPNENQYSHLFAIIDDHENITIFERSFHFDTEVYIKIVKIDHFGQTDNTSLYPTQSDFLPISNVTGYNYNSFMIDKAIISQFKCKDTLNERCALLVSVFNSGSIGAAQIDQETFSISLSIGIKQLEEGRPMISTVDKQNILFYSFYVNDDDASILISLTPLDEGDPDMYVSLGEDQRPTSFAKADWGSLYEGSDSIIINKGSKDIVQNSVQGHYVVGVTTLLSESAQFKLTVTTRKNKFFHIDESSPLEIFIQAGQPVYLEYLVMSQEDFRIILSRDFGNAVISVSPYNNTEDIMKELPSVVNQKYKWTSFNSENEDMLLIPKNPDGTVCKWPCRYLVELFSLNDCKLTVLISNKFSVIHLPNNQVLRDFVDKDNQQTSYIYETSQNFTLVINLYQGKVNIKHHQGIDPSQTIFADKLSEYKIDVNTIQNQNQHYSIEVETVDDNCSNYTITAIPMGEATALRYGVSINSSLEPGQSTVFKFYYLNQNEELADTPISVSVFYKNKDFIKAEDMEILVPEAQLVYKPDNATQLNVYQDVSMIFTHVEQVGHYEIPQPQKGLYKLTLTNNQTNALSRQLTIDFSIVIDNTNIIFLETKHPNIGNVIIQLTPFLLSRYLEQNKFKNYEILVPERSILFLEAYVCKGDMRFTASDDYQEFKNGKTNFEFEKMHSVAHFLKKEVDSGPVYVHARNLNHHKTFYRIKASIYPLGYQLPYELFFMPEDGFTDFKLEDKFLKVRFHPISCEDDCKSLKGSVFAHTYQLLMMNSKESLDQFSRCGGSMMPQEFLDAMHQPTVMVSSVSENNKNGTFWVYKDFQRHTTLDNRERMHFTVPRENLTGIHEFYFLIISRVYITEDVNNTNQKFTSNPSGVEMFTFYYSINHVQEQLGHDRVEQSSKWVTISILLFVFISILIGVLIFLWKKYQTTNQRLNYELSDVRNVARISIEMDDASTRGQDDKYKGFADEKADEQL